MRLHLVLSAGALAGLLLSAPAAFAQNGTTSGPASGSPATLGTGGQSAATPHQRESLQKTGRAVQNEGQGQTGGTSTAPAKPGSEGGPAPSKPH
ncbi:MAG: hypothetical protein JOZ42_08675 [Acetobacteraceae bacterium]|nr:hypothetical protein [Acetobacteraceae bacterium]